MVRDLADRDVLGFGLARLFPTNGRWVARGSGCAISRSLSPVMGFCANSNW